ncbi:hypothetical protein SG34_020190 [Thalassomonas viridans]|uniref:Uncharacterized protein n=1 Tax=Thalassomonas viridans TaxID=137584 RepID=A0AAE9Z0B0_9GAMM|nr:hypothetical protein [Thalassomonas viridans]WDE03684.1 hypothetical protein SG34_020190 [Thalassomonas viridans]
MNILAINANFSTLLKKKYGYGLIILPFGLMLGSIGLLYLALQVYYQYYGYSLEIPLKELPIYEYVFEALVLVLMLFYVLGWCLNALIARVAFGWSNEKIKRVFWQSDVPVHWYKNKDETFNKAYLMSLECWEKTRNKGELYFISKLCLIGFILMLSIRLIASFNGDGIQDINWPYSIVMAVLCSIVWAIFASIIWTKTDKEYMDKIGK